MIDEKLQKLLEKPEEVIEFSDFGYKFDDLEFIKKFQNLEIIDLGHFYGIPDEILNLKKIKSLTILEVSSIEKITNFKNLEYLYVLNYNNEKFPLEELSQLPKLKIVVLGKNSFSTLEYYFKTVDPQITDKIFESFLHNKDKFTNIEHFVWGIVINDITRAYILYNNSVIYNHEDSDFKYDISINIEGEQQKAQQLLKKIKEIIFTVCKKEEIENESFLYKKIKGKYNYSSFSEIDLNRLLSFKQSNIQIYQSNENYTILVDDLLEYIGGREYRIELEEKFENEKLQTQKEYAQAGNSKQITKIKFTDFKLFSSLEFELEKLNIVIGKNGTGKTSLLQGIALALSPINNSEVTYYQYYIRYKQRSADCEAFWGDFDRKAKIYTNSIIPTRNLIPSPFVIAYGTNIFDDGSIKNIDIKTIVDGQGETYKVSSLFDTYSTSFQSPIYVLNYLKDNGHKYASKKQLENIINYLVFTINEFLKIAEIEQYRIDKTVDNFYTIIDNKGYEPDFEDLSEGYRSNILLITDLIFTIFAARNRIFSKEVPINKTFEKAEGVVLIDEFDRHLHPSWQRNFVSKLKNVFPKVQFVLTTHNILSVQSAEGGHALLLKQENGEFTVEQKYIEEGSSIVTIYYEFFDEQKRRFGKETQDMLDEFYVFRNKIISGEMQLNDPKFEKNVKELQKKGEELQNIVNREINQITSQLGK